MPIRRKSLTLAFLVGVLAAGLLLPTSVALQNLTGLHISATSQRAGDTETWTIKFQNPAAGVLDDYRLKWTVPAGFVLNSPVCSYDGGDATTTVNGQTVTCRINEGWVGQGGMLVFHVTNVRAPTSQQVTPHFTTEWQNNAGVTIVTDDEYTTQILNNFLQAVTASTTDSRTGVVTTLSLSFTTKNPVGANGDLRFVLPAGFELQSDAACSIAGLSGLTLTRVSATEGVCNLNSATLAAATAYTLAVSGVKNALYAKTYQVATLETRTAADALHDTAANIAFSLAPRPFAQPPKATPASGVAGEVTSWTFEAKLSNPLPANDYVTVTFPDGFTFNHNGTTALEVVSGTAGHFEAAIINGRTVAARLADSLSPEAGTLLTFLVSHVQNPPVLDSRRGDPNATQAVEFVLAMANDAPSTIPSVKDDVLALLFPCDRMKEDCDGGAPCPPTNTSDACCQARNDCPPPTCSPGDTSPACCTTGGACPADPADPCQGVSNCGRSTPVVPGQPGAGAPKSPLGHAMIKHLFGPNGVLRNPQALLAGAVTLAMIAGIGTFGYVGIRQYRAKLTDGRTIRSTVKPCRPPVPPTPKVKR